MRTPVRVAVIGLGRWGPSLAGAFDSLPQADLRWLCDHDPEAWMRLRSRYPRARVTSDVDELLNDESLDGVVVTTPPVSHYDVTRRALEADKHVLVQWPLALRGEQADDLVRRAERRDRRLVVGNRQLFHPGVLTLKELLGKRRLGEVFYLSCHHHEPRTGSSQENVVWSLGPYDVTIALHLVEDEPVDIVAEGGSYLEPGIIDFVHCQLRFATGIRAQLFLSRLDPRPTCTVAVVGSDKTAVFDAEKPDRNLTVFDGQDDIVSPHLPHHEPLRLECEHFVSAIRSPGHTHLTGREGAAVVNVLEGIQRALEGESLIQVPAPHDEGAKIVSLVTTPSEGNNASSPGFG